MAFYRGALRPWLKDGRQLFRRTAKIPVFRRHLLQFKSSLHESSHDWKIGNDYPCLDDFDDAAGVATGHYFHQDLYVAQCIYTDQPDRHIDVGSRVDGFVAHVASFREIDVVDIRPMQGKVKNINFHQVNFMNNDEVQRLGKWPSVSCLHALEHFGLGRYGDPINADGWLAGIKSLAIIVEEKGVLYLSVPIGIQRIEFNAHRVFSVPTLLGATSAWFELCGFSFVNDEGDFFQVKEITEGEIDSMVAHMKYGLGIFTFRRK